MLKKHKFIIVGKTDLLSQKKKNRSQAQVNPTLTLSFPQNQQKEPSNGHSLSIGETVTP